MGDPERPVRQENLVPVYFLFPVSVCSSNRVAVSVQIRRSFVHEFKTHRWSHRVPEHGERTQWGKYRNTNKKMKLLLWFWSKNKPNLQDDQVWKQLQSNSSLVCFGGANAYLTWNSNSGPPTNLTLCSIECKNRKWTTARSILGKYQNKSTSLVLTGEMARGF